MPASAITAASKAGVIGFTKSWPGKWPSRGITVNAVAPGFIETAMTAKLAQEQKDAIIKQIPLASLGQPEDVAERGAVSGRPGGAYITGQVLRWTAAWRCENTAAESPAAVRESRHL